MSEWVTRVFWTRAEVATAQHGFAVTLDSRPLRTPGKTPLVVPTRALAEAIAEEWAAQHDKVDPTTMPFTRMANSAIEKVKPQHVAIVEMLAAYGDSDLLCYRASQPQALVARQEAGWDPLLFWAETKFGARLSPVFGVMHHPQDPETLAILTRQVEKFDPFALTGFHDLVSLSGSLILGLAAALDHSEPEKLWELSRVDEIWQAEQWGSDEEAEKMAADKRQAFLAAKRFFDLSR